MNGYDENKEALDYAELSMKDSWKNGKSTSKTMSSFKIKKLSMK